MFSNLSSKYGSNKDKKKEEEEKKKSGSPISSGAKIAQNVLKQYQDSIGNRPSSSTNKTTQAQTTKQSAPAQSAGTQTQKQKASLWNSKSFMDLDDAVRAAYVYNSIAYGSGKASDSKMMEAINNSRDRTIRNMRTPEEVVLTPAQAYRNLDNAAKSRWLSSGENNAVPSLLSREYTTKEINANWNKDWLTLAKERKDAEQKKKEADDYLAQFDTPIQEARSGITNQRQLQNNTVAPFDERPDDYNDYADNYDRILYDWGVGEKGAYDKIGRIGSREEILARNERIKELWNDIDNESNRRYNEARRNLQKNKAEYERQKAISEYYGGQLEAIGNRERQRDEYYGLIDQYDDDLTRTDFVPEYDRAGSAPLSMAEMEQGVNTGDVHRIYSFLGGGNEYARYGKVAANQISPEYSYAMMMTDGSNGSNNEIGIFMNLYNKAMEEGRDPVEAKAFLDGLQPALRARYSGYESVRLQEAARQMPILTSAASLAMGMTNTFLDIPRRIAHLLGDKSTEDPNSWWYATTRQSKQIQDTISEDLGGVAGKAYLSLMNSASNLVRGLTTAGAGGKAVQSIMGLGGFFLSVDQEATGRYLQDGYSYDQAQKKGAVDGMFEVAEEFLPFETMLGTEGAKFITSWVLNGLSEFGQEFTGGVLFDEIKATLTGQNDRNDRVNEIIVNGSYTDRNGNQVVLSDDPATAMQQARLQAGKEQMQNALEGGIGGFIGGGLGGFYGTANRAINDVYTGAAINQETNVSDGKKAIESLIEVGKNTKDEGVQKLAEKVEGQYKGKGKAGDYLTGKLFRAVADATGAEGQETVKGAAWRVIRDDLTDKGVNREAAGEYAEIVAKGLLGEKLTNEDKKTLAKDQLAIDTWKRFNTKTADAAKIIEEVNEATREQRSVMDTLGEIAGTKPTAGEAMGAELEQSLQKTGGDMERALDDMFSRRSDLLSERYVGAVKESMADKTSPKNKSFLKDAMQIRAAAMTLGAMPKTSMDEATARKLYDEARAEFDEIDKNQRVLKQKTVEPGKGTASFGDAEYGTESWTQKMAGYSKQIRNQAGALAEVAKRAGLSLTFIDDARVDAKTGRDNAKINGFENQDGSIVINLAATEKYGKHMLTTMAHEMTHWLEQNSREGYDSLRQFVLGSLRNKGVNVEQLAVNTIDNQNAVLKGGEGLDFNGAVAEIVAKSCEELLSSRSFQQELAKTDPGTFDKVKTFVKDFVARINAALKDMVNYYGSLSWEARQLRDYTEEIGNLWIGARREALGRNAEEGAEAGEGTRFSTAQETAAEERDAKRLKLETPEMLRYSMVGAAAGGSYAERIREAEALSRQGVDAEEIYQQTGAREGFNGKWWVTLDNQNIRMRDGIMEKHRSGKKFRLTEVMDAPELMKAYPALEDIKVQFKRMRAAYGAYHRDTNTIEVDLDTARTNPEMTAITLRHEIQHAIQRIEGVEGGASLYSWKEILDRIGSTEHPLNMYQRSVGEIEARAASKLEGPGMPTREQYANAVSMQEYANMRFSLADEERNDRKYLDAVERGDIAAATDMLMEKLKKTEGVIPFIAQHGFGGKHAEIAKMIKEGTQESVAAAAYDMAAQVPANAVLIPMPNHSGKVTEDTDTMILAQAISRISGRPVVNAMAGNARESRYKAKAEGRKGATAEELGFRKVAELPEGTMPVFIDNVVGSGVTAQAARNAFGGGITLAYAKSTRSKGIEGLKNAIITRDSKGNVIPLSQRFDTSIRDVRFSTQDQEYMDAVERGDTAEQQRLVDEFAEKALSESKIRKEDGKLRKLYHGTWSNRFTVFDPKLIGTAREGDVGFFGRGFYFAFSKGEAKAYGGNVMEVYLDIKNPFNYLKELNTLDGERTLDYNASRAVFITNFAEKFPELAKKHTVDVWKDGKTSEISLKEFAEQYRKIVSEKEFKIEKQEDPYDGDVWVALGDRTTKSYTNEDGETFTWDEYGYQKKFYTEKDARNKLTNAYEYMEKNVYDGMSLPNSTVIIQETDFSNAVKKRGYDGVIQSEEGDEVVAFTSEQIKSADPVTYDDAGNVIPLSERFNTEQKDIRYSVQDETDMNVNHFMMGMQEGSLQTEQERTMLRQYKELHGALEVSRFALADYRKKLAKIEAMTNPSAYDRAEALKLRNLISNYVAKVDRLQEKLAQVTSSEGYAGMMYRQSRIMDDLVNGRSADEVTRTVSALNDRLRKVDAEIAKRQMQIDYLKSNLAGKKLETLVDSKSLDQMARIIRKEYGSTYSKEDLMHDMTAIRLKMAQGQKVDADVEELAWRILQQTKNGGGEDLQALRGITITLGAKQVKELLGSNSSMKELRSIFAGTGVTIRTAKAGEQGLDTDWQQLCDMLPNLNRDAQELDQVDELIRFVQSQKESMNPNKRYKDQIQGIAEEIQAMIATVGMNAPADPAAMQILQKMSGLVDEMAGGLAAGKREMEVARKEIANLVDEGRLAIRGAEDLQKTIETAIQYNNALSKQSEAARWKHDKAALVAQLKDENTKALLKEQAKWKEKIERDRQARESMATNMHLRHQINTNVVRIRKLLLNETDLKNIPEHMKSLAREMLGMILENDATGGRKITGIVRKDIFDTLRALDEMKKQDGKFTMDDIKQIHDEEAQAVVEDSLADIEDGITLYNGKPGNSLLDNLDDYRKALESIEKGVTSIIKIIDAERNITIGNQKRILTKFALDTYYQMKNSRFRGEWRGRGSKAVNAVRGSVAYGNLTPVYFFKNLRNAGMSDLWGELQRGENRSGLEYRKAKDYLGALAEKAHYKEWAGKKITVRIGSRQVEMTVDNAMEILAIWNREQLATAEAPDKSNHMTKGGIYIRQEEDNKGGLHREQEKQRPMRVNESDIAGIREALTDEQKEYMDKVVSYLSNEMSQLGNEASMRMYGIKKYKEEYYFPMKIWDGVKSARSDKGITGTNENRAAHKSWSKRRINKAYNALVIGSFTEDAVNHIVEMINYNTMAPAIENINKVLNLKFSEMSEDGEETTRNVRIAFQEAYGRDALKYLETFLKDLNGGAVQDQRKTLRDRMLSVFKKNAVAGSLSVTLQQPLSYVRAAMMLNPMDLARALNPTYWKGSYAEMQKYSGVAVIKDMGRFDMNFGQSAKEFIEPKKKESAYKMISDKLTVAPELADRATWTRMWSACKIEQHRLHPEMDITSDEFLQLVAERFNDMVRRTQVYDSVLVKSSNMRSQKFEMKLLTSFMAEPTLSLNVLADAVQNFKDKGGKALVAKAAATFLVSAALQAAVKGLMGSGRSPDEKKTKAENFLYKYLQAFLSEANPISLIPGYGDLVELLKNGELSDDAMGVIGKVTTVWKTSQDVLNGKGRGVYRDLEDTVGQVAQLFWNIPAKNIMRDLRATVTWFSGSGYADRPTSGAVIRHQAKAQLANADNLIGVINKLLGDAGFKTTNSAYYQRMFDAMQGGNQAEADSIREYLTLGKGVKEESIVSGLKSAAKTNLEAAEASEWIIDQGLMSGTGTITTDYKEGKITFDEAKRLMKKADPEKTDNEIWWRLDRIRYTQEKGLKEEPNSEYYYRLTDAINANKAEEIRKAVKDLLDHGVTREKIIKKIGDWKSPYKTADTAAERRVIRDALQKTYKAMGLTAADADKKIDSWYPESSKSKKKKN